MQHHVDRGEPTLKGAGIIPARSKALFGLKMKAPQLLIQGTEMRGLVADWDSEEIKVGAVAHHEDRFHASAGASVNMKSHVSVHGEWSSNSRRTWEPTRQTAKFIRFGTTEHPVEEVVVYGSQLIGNIGTGVIKKLILVDKANTHAQEGASWGLSANVGEVAKSGVSAISSVTLGIKGGDSSRVVGGKAIFSVPGVTILEPIESVSAAEYDRRFGIKVTQHYTPAGQPAGAYDPALSGQVDLGEHTAGFEIPNAFTGGHTETTSQRLRRQAAEQAAAEAKKAYEEKLESPYSGKAAAEVNHNLLKKAFGKFEAENPTFVRDELGKEGERLKQLEAALYAADEPRRKSEPAGGATLPATASSKAPTYVDPKGMDSSKAIQRIVQQKEVEQALTTMFTTEQLQENVSAAREAERIKNREAQNAHESVKERAWHDTLFTEGTHPMGFGYKPEDDRPVSKVQLLPTVSGSTVAAPMPGINPTLSEVRIAALGNPVTAGIAGIAGTLGMDYQTQRHEIEMAYEGWRKGDASLLPDMMWSQPAARDMMEREIGYPFGRPDLALSAVSTLESPLPTRAPQACGGLDIPVQGKPQPISTPMPAPTRTVPLVTPMPEPMATPVLNPSPGLTEGFDIHRPSAEDLVKYKKKDVNGYEQPRAHPAPDVLPAFPEAKKAPRKTAIQGGGGLRRRWKDKDNIYEWDAQHGTVEKYDKRGKHQGEFDPNSGEQTKPQDPSRRIEP